LHEHHFDALSVAEDENPALDYMIAGVDRKIQRKGKLNLDLKVDIQEIFLNVNIGSSM